MLVRFDTSDLIRLRNALYNHARRGVPYAARNALNRSAFEARREWIEKAEETFTLRNRWTKGSMRVDRARGRDMSRMEAVVGSLADYMATQEEGGTVRRQGRTGHPIPTTVASGEGMGTGTRKRVVRRPNRLPRIALGQRGRSGQGARQRNAIAISTALKDRRRFVFLELGRRKGIFRLAGGRRRTRIEMVWDMSRTQVRVPASKTLERSLAAVAPRLPALHREAFIEQLRRNGVIR